MQFGGETGLGLGLGLGFVVLLWGVTGGMAATPITGCTTIDTPGSYELTGAISNGTADPCIEITTGDVSLDGAGHTVDGAGSGTGTGILARGNGTLTNVTVRNLTVTGFQRGIRYRHLTQGTVTDATVTANTGLGILLETTSDTTVATTTVSGHARGGIRIHDSTNTAVDTLDVTANGGAGIAIQGDSDHTDVTASTISDNRHGISITSRSNHTTIAATSITNNTIDGVAIDTANGTHLQNVTATANGGWALHQVDDGVTTTTTFDVGSAVVATRSEAVALGPIDAPTSPPTGQAAAGGRLNATDTGSGAVLRLNLTYTTTAGVDEPSLRLWRHDGSWSQLPAPNTVDTTADVVSATITTFPPGPAEYAALGNASTATPTPTPTPTATATPTSTPTPTPTATPTGTQTVGQPPATPQPSPTPPPVTVGDCMDIDQPGSYVLTQDLLDRSEDVCIDIRTGGVTLDGTGHTIDSDGSSSTAAIRAADPAGGTLTDVAVHSVEVSDWAAGVRYASVGDGAVEAVTVVDNVRGVDIEDSTAVTVDGVDGSDNGEAGGTLGLQGGTVRVMDTTDSIVRAVDATPSSGAFTGVTVSGGTNVTVAGVTVDGGEIGVMAAGGADHLVRSATVVAPGAVGVNAQSSSRFELHDSSITDSPDHGVGIVALQDARVVNVTVANSGTHALTTNPSVTNLTVRMFTVGAATAPTTVDAAGDSFTLSAVPSPPSDPGGEQNLSRFVAVGGTNPSVLVNVSYTAGDVVAADVNDTTIDPWVHDGTWSQATGTAGTDTGGQYVYVQVSSADVVVAPLGEAGSGASIGAGAGFGGLAALVAVVAALAVMAGLARRS